MHRTIIIRREYLHFIPKYARYEKRHKNLAAHVSPAFRVEEGDRVTVGQCRPLSKTVCVMDLSGWVGVILMGIGSLQRSSCASTDRKGCQGIQQVLGGCIQLSWALWISTVDDKINASLGHGQFKHTSVVFVLGLCEATLNPCVRDVTNPT